MARRKTAQRGVKALGEGRYELRLYIHGRDYIRTVEAKTTAEAQAIRLQEMERLRKETAPPDRSKLSAVAATWLEKKKAAKRRDGSKRLTPNTIARYTNAIEKHIVPLIGEFTIDDLTKPVIVDWRDALGENFASATVNGVLRVLKQILADNGSKAAWRVEALEQDDTRITEDEPNLLTTAELKRFLEAARELCEEQVARTLAARVKRPKALGPATIGETLYPLMLFMVTTGCRISTARAVRWEDLDPAEGVVHLRRRYSGKEVLPGVKRSRISKDVAPLLPELATLLEAKRAAFTDEQRASGLVFPAVRPRHAGDPIGPVARSVLDEPFQRWLAKAGITKRFTPHGLRRTAALAYRLAGTSTLARDILGHRTEEMHRHYAPEQTEERRAAAERAFSGLV